MLLCGAPLSNSLLTHWIRLKDLAYLWMTCKGGVEVHNVYVLLRRVRIDLWENRKIITHSNKECLYQKLHSWTTVMRKNIETESKKVGIWIEPMCCNTSCTVFNKVSSQLWWDQNHIPKLLHLSECKTEYRLHLKKWLLYYIWHLHIHKGWCSF